VASVGIFGEVEIPSRDLYADGKEFVFVSTDFEAKGGRTVLAAFCEVKQCYPETSLVIIGDRPIGCALEPGVRFAGFLRKEVPEEYGQFREIISRARAIVSATKSDICPLLFIEAGYFGCPIISIRRFAIPEIVEDQRTGILLNDSPTPVSFASAMSRMLEMKLEYSEMRQAARAKACMHTREQFEKRLCFHLAQVTASDYNELASSR
jgi:glycosyltransferase involved in cell wall biosynthesis